MNPVPAFLLALVLSAGPETPPPSYDLAGCLEIAGRLNPEINTAREEIEAASGQKLQAVSSAIPSLRGSADYTYLNTVNEFDILGEAIPLNRHDNYGLGLTLEQILYDGGKVFAGIAAADFLEGYTQAGLDEARSEVFYRVKQQYYLLLQQEGIARVREDTVRHMTDYRDTARNKYRQGTISEFDLITSEVRLANAQPPRIEARNQVDIYKTALAREMGVEHQDFEVGGELGYIPFAVPLETLNRLGLENRSLLKQADFLEKIQRENLSASRSGYQPRLSAYATWEGRSPDSSTPPEYEFESEWFAGARLTWDIFDGLMTPGKVAEARARLNQARIRSQDSIRTVLLAIKQAFLNLNAAREAWESQRQTVQQAEKAYQIARIRWDNGIGTSLELTDAELNLSEAKVMLEQTMAYYLIALAGIERSVGLPLEEIVRRDAERAANEKEG